MPTKKTRTKLLRSNTANLGRALAAIIETVASLCECGHFDSEHLGGVKAGTYKRCVAEECGCLKFAQGFDIEVLPKAKTKPKAAKEAKSRVAK